MDKREVKMAAKRLAAATLVAMLQTLRFALFMALLTIGPPLEKLLLWCSRIAFACVCALAVMRLFELPMLAFLGVAIGARVVVWGLQALSTVLAPDGWIVVHEN